MNNNGSVQKFTYEIAGHKYNNLWFKLNRYRNNTLMVTLTNGEDIFNLSTNIEPSQLGKDEIYINHDFAEATIEFLINNNCGQLIPSKTRKSGWVDFSVFKFHQDFLNGVDSYNYDIYEKLFHANQVPREKVPPYASRKGNTLTVSCILCGSRHEIILSDDNMVAYIEYCLGDEGFIQDYLPEVPAAQRELLKGGFCECVYSAE